MAGRGSGNAQIVKVAEVAVDGTAARLWQLAVHYQLHAQPTEMFDQLLMCLPTSAHPSGGSAF